MLRSDNIFRGEFRGNFEIDRATELSRHSRGIGVKFGTRENNARVIIAS